MKPLSRFTILKEFVLSCHNAQMMSRYLRRADHGFTPEQYGDKEVMNADRWDHLLNACIALGFTTGRLIKLRNNIDRHVAKINLEIHSNLNPNN